MVRNAGRRAWLVGTVAAAVLPACLGVRGSRAAGPSLVVLGTAQDGGFPHAGCSCERCARARGEPSRARRVASVAVVSGQRAWLVDATPDLPAQLEALALQTGRPRGEVDRSPVEGVLLTHAHIGHYLGLAWLGFEALHTQGTPVYASREMAAFLRSNAPWDQLVRFGNVRLVEFAAEAEVQLGEVQVRALEVPHRDEYTDTLGYILAGPRRRALYVPDSAPWQRWPRPLPEVIRAARVDLALIDGCFYSADELPGRDLSTLAHPLITESMDLLQPLVDAGTLQVLFTHLNHSNPAIEAGAATAEIERRGFAVAREGLELPI